jgi:DNA polymerase I
MLVVEDGPEEQSWYSFRQWARQQPIVAFDTETTGLRPYQGDRLVGVSIGVGDQTWYLPFRHEVGPNLSPERLRETVDYLQTRDQLIGHNTKFDLHMLIQEGFEVPTAYDYQVDCPVLDTLLGAHLVNENERSPQIPRSGFALKYLSDKYGIGQGSKDEEELREVVTTSFRQDITAARKDGAEMKGSIDGMWKGFMWKLPPEQVAPYAEADVLLTWGLMQEHVWPSLQGWGLVPLFHQVCNYNLLVTRMEQLGVTVDQDVLERETQAAIKKAERAENDLWLATGINNSNSSTQCSRFFNLKSTKEQELKLAMMEGRANAEHAELLLDARGRRKVVESYFVPYRRFLGEDGAIHPGFKVHGTATGRLSCSDPNVMALPRDVTNQPAKSVFVARPGHVLVEIDLSQAELRVASHFAAQVAESTDSPDRYFRSLDDRAAGLTNMGAVLAEEESDLHTITMLEMQVYNQYVNRDLAKRINLSAIFGIGAKKFSWHYAIPVSDSREALTIWRDVYPEFALLYEVMEQIASRQGYITLPISGRVRRYTNTGDNFTNKASSNLVQGTVADIMRIAMHNVAAFVEQNNYGRLLLQVHDSLLLELWDDQFLTNRVKEIQRIMQDFHFAPPLRSEMKIGQSWGQMKPRESRHDKLGAPA